ncbi:uncharacterized protein SPPG_02509 [Spizellomyces punctatus DAOM BR117]|uniref:Ran guanine nucleotide release factor n=1 Tax=Spizellomyces punctatus (strain DAOM BR117) TaxID=645134 RepID=A0A0L0HLR6_SPIPD|nr:uncharacterized protein SPPG_02509 [Spizellomyces punctatus DAOM BR117]KND02003.1 hypothetical protein SPPG_02509 [Spizellomyces punctatus DAOM BR117]|eukprot:XP_016610042.1 hypothetical protein SPPG_02509 [Spizellomyces punctatus DAOM BR117]
MPIPQPTQASPSESRELYGGAIVTDIPISFLDASDFREVPSNQEVFVDQNTDQSIIIELLELASDADDAEAANFHFQQLAEDNDAAESRVLSVEYLDPATVTPSLPSTVHLSVIVGEQVVSKFREGNPNARNLVAIYMAVLRIPHVTTDLVISYNHPVALGQSSSSATALRESGGHVGVPEVAMENFRNMLRRLRIVDWGLFGA